MHARRNNKKNKTYLQGLKLFGKTLPRSIKNILKKNSYNYSEIVNKWNELVGKDVANHSYPKSIRINREGDGATLIIKVKRGNEILLEYSKKIIIDKINSYFGYRLIDKIRLEGINSEIKKNKSKPNLNKHTPKFEEQIKKIKNKNIKKSLNKLIDAIKYE